MKKIFYLMLALFVSASMMTISSSAQKAIQKSKLLDNTYVGGQVGVGTNLDFNGTFPLNTTIGLKAGKNFTPIVGANVEAQVGLGDNFTHKSLLQGRLSRYGESKTFIKTVYVGLNGTLNWSNLLFGYKGTPRTFEVGTETGLGWLHLYGFEGYGNIHSKGFDDVVGKAGVNVAYNFGGDKQYQLYVQPAVYWNFTAETPNKNFNFNKHDTELGVQVGFLYKFKTSNGTHNFKVYDVGALNSTINKLRAENEALKNQPPKVIEKIVEKTVPAPTNTKEAKVITKYVVFFSRDSYELSDVAKKTLDAITTNSAVDVLGAADEVGATAYNQKLSEKRAETVATYLKNRGLKVDKTTATGETGEIVARVVVVTTK